VSHSRDTGGIDFRWAYPLSGEAGPPECASDPKDDPKDDPPGPLPAKGLRWPLNLRPETSSSVSVNTANLSTIMQSQIKGPRESVEPPKWRRGEQVMRRSLDVEFWRQSGFTPEDSIHWSNPDTIIMQTTNWIAFYFIIFGTLNKIMKQRVTFLFTFSINRQILIVTTWKFK